MNNQMYVTNDGNPTMGEIDAILVAIGTDPSVVTDIKDRVDAQLAEEELAPADADRFKQAVDWLTELGVIVSNKVGVISIGHLDRLDWIRWA